MWQAVDDWLLRGLLVYLDDNDVYRLWVFAEEHGLDRVCDYLTVSSVRAPLSSTRALHLAMGGACWTAVCRLTKSPHKQRLSRRSVDDIVHEIQRHTRNPLAPHPRRETAMQIAAPPGAVPPFVMYFAMAQGKFESIIWLHHVARYDPPEALHVAARHGHDHMIAWLLNNAHTAQWVTLHCAVERLLSYEDNPALDLVAWRVTHRGVSHVSAYSPRWGFADTNLQGDCACGVFDLPARHGDLESVKMMLGIGTFQNEDPVRTVWHAACAGHLEVVQWLYKHYPNVSYNCETLVKAAASGQLEVVQWVAVNATASQGLRQPIEAAARNGHLHVMQWLSATAAALCIDDQLLDLVCRRGHVPIAQWIVEERGIQVEEKYLQTAADAGHLNLFRWLLTHLQEKSADPFRWNLQWLDGAAASGNVAFVRWLVQDCSLWSHSAIVGAKSPEIVEFLYTFAFLNNRQLANLTDVECAATIRDGDFETITALLRHGLRTGHFDKKWFDHIHDFEALFAWKQEQLGWSDDYTPAHECWPRTLRQMGNLREMVGLAIDVYDPEFLVSIAWLPAWAVQHGTITNLERLVAIEHGHLLTHKVFRQLMLTSSDTDKVQWFLLQAPSLFSTSVLQWAVQFDKRRFLSWLLDEFLPARQRELGSELSFRCEQTALRSAQKCGREEIAHWLEVRTKRDGAGQG